MMNNFNYNNGYNAFTNTFNTNKHFDNKYYEGKTVKTYNLHNGAKIDVVMFGNKKTFRVTTAKGNVMTNIEDYEVAKNIAMAKANH